MGGVWSPYSICKKCGSFYERPGPCHCVRIDRANWMFAVILLVFVVVAVLAIVTAH